MDPPQDVSSTIGLDFAQAALVPLGQFLAPTAGAVSLPVARAAHMRAMAAGYTPRIDQLDPRPSWDELEPVRFRTAYRLARYVLQALGYLDSNHPIAFALEDKDFPDPSKPLRARKSPLPSATGLPGIRNFRHMVKVAELVPNDPEGPYLADTAAAWESAARALHIDQPTPWEDEKGLIGLVQDSTGRNIPHRVFLKILFHRAPTLDELITTEQDLLTALARTLMETNEDTLRLYLRRNLCRTEWEAYTLTQTAKVWASALRPIDLETERVLVLRSLETVRERAIALNDLSSAIQANHNIARITGMLVKPPGMDREEQFRSFDRFTKEQDEFYISENGEESEEEAPEVPQNGHNGRAVLLPSPPAHLDQVQQAEETSPPPKSRFLQED